MVVLYSPISSSHSSLWSPPPHVLLRTPVASFPGRHSVSLQWFFIILSLPIIIALVEILSCAVLLFLLRGSVEIVEHQIHILALLSLQVLQDVLISVHLDLDARICLPRKGPRFVEITIVIIFTTQKLLIANLPIFLLLISLVLTYIESLPSIIVACLSSPWLPEKLLLTIIGLLHRLCSLT